MSFTPGKSFTITALGKQWTLSRISLEMIFAFRDFIKDHLPNPLEGPIAKVFDKLPVEEQIERVKKAESIGEQLACFSMRCELAQEYLQKEEGQAHWAKLWLQEFHPDVSLEVAFSIFTEASQELARAFEVTQGSMKTPGQGPPMQISLGQSPPGVTDPGSISIQGNSQTPAPTAA